MLVSVISIRGRTNTSTICSENLEIKTGEYQFCIQAVLADAKGQTLFLKMWELFGKVVWMTSGTFVELEEEQKKDAIEKIDSNSLYSTVVKLTNDGFKLTKLVLAGENNAEGAAVFPPAMKAKKTAKKTTAEQT